MHFYSCSSDYAHLDSCQVDGENLLKTDTSLVLSAFLKITKYFQIQSILQIDSCQSKSGETLRVFDSFSPMCLTNGSWPSCVIIQCVYNFSHAKDTQNMPYL